MKKITIIIILILTLLLTLFNFSAAIYSAGVDFADIPNLVYTVLMTEISIGDSTISLWALLGGGAVLSLILLAIIRAFLR